MNGSVLAVRDLRVTYMADDAVVEAVKGVDFSVPAGSVLAVIGGSGAGKSSVALAIAGLHDPARTRVAGEVIVDGADVARMNDEQLNEIRGKKVGVIFQDARGALDPTMKVVNQVAATVRRHRVAGRDEARAEALERLHNVGVSEGLLRLAPYPHQLSSGLCQRVMIAIALAGDPGLLVADEPTGSLDLTRQAQIIRLLRGRVDKDGLGMVLITHDLGLAMAVADHLLVMHDGIQVEYGPCKEIIEAPRHGYTNELLAAWRRICIGNGESHAVT